MLLVVILVTALALCTATDWRTAHLLQPKNETANNTITVLQANRVLRLTRISATLAEYVCRCLKSRFIKELDNGAERTLECYSSQISVDNPTQVSTELSTNVTMLVTNEPTDPYAVINVYDPTHMIPEKWQEYYDLLYATGFCFIVKTKSGRIQKEKPPCVVLQLDSAREGHIQGCYEIFEQKCESATPSSMENSKQCLETAQRTTM